MEFAPQDKEFRQSQESKFVSIYNISAFGSLFSINASNLNGDTLA